MYRLRSAVPSLPVLVVCSSNTKLPGVKHGIGSIARHCH